MQDLERAPFARALRLWLHRFPRRSSQHGDWDWELDRGFHLQVLDHGLFELHLRPRTPAGEPSLALLPGATAQGRTKLLVWQKAHRDDDWEGYARTLARSQPWAAGLILSQLEHYGDTVRTHFRRKRHWCEVGCPVVELFQQTPPAEEFFTVEKSLFVLGRVGRRLQRYARIRRLLP